MFYLQFMVDFLSGLPGDLAVSPVEKASKRGVVYATALFQPMAASHVKGQIQKCATVNISRVQVHLFIQCIGICSIDTHVCALTVNCPSISTVT